MQDLIVGERYHIKHMDGVWEGDVTFDGFDGRLIKVSDILVTGGDEMESVKRLYNNLEGKTRLGGFPEWWGFELVNISLENE